MLESHFTLWRCVLQVCILKGVGLNCEEETSFAFMQASRHLKIPATCNIVHVADLLNKTVLLKDYNIFVIPGGFSYGDYVRSGTILSASIRSALAEDLQDFISRDTLLLGICNGCQVLLHLCEEFKDVFLEINDSDRYRCMWHDVEVNKECESVWLKECQKLRLPIAHKEGKFQIAEGASLDNANIAFQYINGNPTGSERNIAAVSAKKGRILAMMPHPERAIHFHHTEDWQQIKESCVREGKDLPVYGPGFSMFENSLRYFM